MSTGSVPPARVRNQRDVEAAVPRALRRHKTRLRQLRAADDECFDPQHPQSHFETGVEEGVVRVLSDETHAWAGVGAVRDVVDEEPLRRADEDGFSPVPGPQDSVQDRSPVELGWAMAVLREEDGEAVGAPVLDQTHDLGENDVAGWAEAVLHVNHEQGGGHFRWWRGPDLHRWILDGR